MVGGIGVLPNVELAQAAGLTVRKGIVVDAFLKTTDPNIFAIGDCAEAANGMCLESVQNAADQGKSVATQIVHGPSAYRAVPWFWTDQFDVKLQMAGISVSAAQGGASGDYGVAGSFRCFISMLRCRLTAVDSVNRPGDHIVARKMLAARTGDEAAERAADESVDLKGLL